MALIVSRLNVHLGVTVLSSRPRPAERLQTAGGASLLAAGSTSKQGSSFLEDLVVGLLMAGALVSRELLMQATAKSVIIIFVGETSQVVVDVHTVLGPCALVARCEPIRAAGRPQTLLSGVEAAVLLLATSLGSSADWINSSLLCHVVKYVVHVVIICNPFLRAEHSSTSSWPVLICHAIGRTTAAEGLDSAGSRCLRPMVSSSGRGPCKVTHPKVQLLVVIVFFATEVGRLMPRRWLCRSLCLLLAFIFNRGDVVTEGVEVVILLLLLAFKGAVSASMPTPAKGGGPRP